MFIYFDNCSCCLSLLDCKYKEMRNHILYFFLFQEYYYLMNLDSIKQDFKKNGEWDL